MPRPTDTTPAMRRRVSSDRRQVKVLVHPPQGEFEVSVAMEVFRTKPHNYRRQHDVRLCTERPGPVTMPGGPDLQVFEGMLQLRSADIVIVAGWDPDREISPERLQRLVIGLRRAHRSGAQLVGLNTGAYLLAETGLLDGRRATIDWRLPRRSPVVIRPSRSTPARCTSTTPTSPPAPVARPTSTCACESSAETRGTPTRTRWRAPSASIPTMCPRDCR